MKATWMTTFLFAWMAAHTCAQPAIPVSDKISTFQGKEVELLPSWVKHREELNGDYLKSLDPDRLLHNFRINAGIDSKAQPLEGWEAPWIGLRGHFTGHYLSAVSAWVERYDDPLLSERLAYMVSELHKCQQALGNGYLSAFPETEFDKLEAGEGGIWAPYYTYHKIMQGLLDAYVRTGNEEAFRMVTDMADYVEARMSRLDEETIEKALCSSGANPANEAGAMNEVLHKLYLVSGNPKHLALAKLFDRDWFAVPLAQHKDRLSGLHANTHLVLVNGFVQRYRATGETKYRDAALNFWDMLVQSHSYANGSSSGPRPNVVTPTSLSAEHWGVPGVLSNTLTREIAESCVSHNTQKLNASLFCWTGNPVYADHAMNMFYNAVMASQNRETGATVYHLPLGSPRNKKFLQPNDFRCCNGSCIEAFSSLNTGIYYHDASSLWVNLYVPSRLNWNERKFTLEQQGDFPNDSVVSFTVSLKKKETLGINFLIPSWANDVEVYVNDEKQHVAAVPGEYLTVARTWSNRDCIRLVFSYKFHAKAMPDDQNMIALFHGPVMLAFKTHGEIQLTGTPAEIIGQLSKRGNEYVLENGGKTYSLLPLYEVTSEAYGVYAKVEEWR